MTRPPTPPVAYAHEPWRELEDADGIGEFLADLPALLLVVLVGLGFLAIVILVVLMLVRLAKFPWLA